MIVLGWIISGMLLLWLTGNLFTVVLQRHFIMHPRRSAEDAEYRFPVPFEEVYLKPDAHTRLHALWFMQEGRPRGVVLYFHGNAGNLERWGDQGPFFADLGYDLIIPDYRKFGKSTGRLSEKSLYEDAGRWYAFVKQQYPDHPVILFGRSMGSGIACHLAAHYPAAQLILETPFSGMKRLFFHYYPFLPRIFFFAWRFPNLENLKKVTCPVRVITGTRDWVVPYRCASELKSVLKSGDEFVTLSGGSHNNLRNYPLYHETLRRWLGAE